MRNRTSPKFALLLGAGVSVVIACGGTVTSGVTAPATSDQFATSFAHAVCDNIASCCQKNSFGFNAANCMSGVQGVVQANLVSPALQLGATYNEANASTCLSKLAAAVQQCSDTSEQDPLGGACDNVFTGTKQPGQSCPSESTAECAAPPAGSIVECISYGSVVSSPDGGSSEQSGTLCQLTTPGAMGAACGSASTSVVVVCGGSTTGDLTCNTMTNTCQPRAAVGASCNDTSDCVLTAYCNNNQVCTTRPGAGTACSLGADATGDGNPCDASSYCDPTSMMCLPRLAPGKACTESTPDQCVGSCTNAVCVSSQLADPVECGG